MFVLFLHFLVEGGGGAFWNGQAPPIVIPDHLADVDDLADMMRVMGELAVDGVDCEERLVPDRDRPEQIIFAERAKGFDQAAPAFLPHVEELRLIGGGRAEFLIPVTARFLSVLREEVCPPADHIAVHMLYDDRDGIGLFGGNVIEILFFQLGEGHVTERLVGEQAFDRRIEIGGTNRIHSLLFSIAIRRVVAASIADGFELMRRAGAGQYLDDFRAADAAALADIVTHGCQLFARMGRECGLHV